MKNKTIMWASTAVFVLTTAASAERGGDGHLNIIYW